jgi:hypothetical protein
MQTNINFSFTVNTTARMESTGARDRIHISPDTAQFLVDAGKSHWLVARDERVQAKGKGEMQTFWLEIKSQTGASTVASSAHSSSGFSDEEEGPSLLGPNVHEELSKLLDDKTKRLVEWNKDVLARLLKQIVARRNASTAASNLVESHSSGVSMIGREDKTVIDEVKEIIHLPEFDAAALKNQQNLDTIELDPEVSSQLRNLVTSIAMMYKANPFHSFEHASHVTMSVVK